MGRAPSLSGFLLLLQDADATLQADFNPTGTSISSNSDAAASNDLAINGSLPPNTSVNVNSGAKALNNNTFGVQDG